MQAQEKLKIPAELKAAVRAVVDFGILANGVATLKGADLGDEYKKFLKAIETITKYIDLGGDEE